MDSVPSARVKDGLAAGGVDGYRTGSARGRSSVGRAPEWHSGGQGFDSPRLHQRNQRLTPKIRKRGKTPGNLSRNVDRSGQLSRNDGRNQQFDHPMAVIAVSACPESYPSYLKASQARFPTVQEVVADGIYAGQELAAATSIVVNIVRELPDQVGIPGAAAPKGGGAVLCLDQPKPPPRQGLRGDNRFRHRLPLRRVRHAAGQADGSFRMRFESTLNSSSSPLALINQGDSLRLRIRNHHQRGGGCCHKVFWGSSMKRNRSSAGLTSLAGLPLYLDLIHASGLGAAIRQHVHVAGAQGWLDIQMVLAVIFLNLAGGDCVEDLERLENDSGFAAILRAIERDLLSPRRAAIAESPLAARHASARCPRRRPLSAGWSGFHDPAAPKAVAGSAFIPAMTEELQGLWR